MRQKWADEVAEALLEGRHVLLTMLEPDSDEPLVMTVGRGERGTAEFSEEGIKLLFDTAPEIVEVHPDGTREVRSCQHPMAITESLSVPCVLPSGHSGAHFYGDDD